MTGCGAADRAEVRRTRSRGHRHARPSRGAECADVHDLRRARGCRAVHDRAVSGHHRGRPGVLLRRRREADHGERGRRRGRRAAERSADHAGGRRPSSRPTCRSSPRSTARPWGGGWSSRSWPTSAIASDRAKFGELFVKRGLNCDVAGLGRLAGLVGPRDRRASCCSPAE